MYTYKTEFKLANRYTSYLYIILLLFIFFFKNIYLHSLRGFNAHHKCTFHIYSLAYVTHDDYYIRPEQKRALDLIQHSTYP